MGESVRTHLGTGSQQTNMVEEASRGNRNFGTGKGAHSAHRAGDAKPLANLRSHLSAGLPDVG